MTESGIAVPGCLECGVETTMFPKRPIRGNGNGVAHPPGSHVLVVFSIACLKSWSSGDEFVE